jgi:formate hydrogenlyase subunit 3/multisubunit Na+/H+ antiporter MnhD subunit
MTALVLLVVLFPLLGAGAAAVGARARLAGTALALGGAGSLASAIALAVRTTSLGHFQSWSGFLYVDSLGAFFSVVVSVVVLLASTGSAAYLTAEQDRGELSNFQVRLYFASFSVFASAMLAVFLTGNLGLLWILVE